MGATAAAGWARAGLSVGEEAHQVDAVVALHEHFAVAADGRAALLVEADALRLRVRREVNRRTR